ncbi:MAG: hypothetical protein RSE32_02940 [Comamonas sp.]|uniref:hypothetical protein n=1 Tax=Comamonas sp. TaxID=34028 RepID=UPI002FC7F484
MPHQALRPHRKRTLPPETGSGIASQATSIVRAPFHAHGGYGSFDPERPSAGAIFCKKHWPYLNFLTFFSTHFCLQQGKKQRFKPRIRLLNAGLQSTPTYVRGKLRQNTGNNGQTH